MPFGILCLLLIYISTQSYLRAGVDYSAVKSTLSNTLLVDTVARISSTTSNKSTPRLINIKQAGGMYKREGNDYQILLDSVIFYHDGAYLFCDSAYFDRMKNSFEAFSNVRMEQGDTIFLYGEYMHYNGNTKLMKVRQDVMMENVRQNVQLYTEHLDYDRVRNIGYYFDGGELVDTLNTLTSLLGQYEPSRKLAIFSANVTLVNPDFTLYSDSLRYNTGTKVATILSESKIVSDSGVIYTSRGWHNTETKKSLLLDYSTIENKQGNRILKGDSILYNQMDGFGEVFGNMHLVDTTKQLILKGNYGFYNERTDYAMATDSAYAIDYSQGDSLFIYGDTLKLTSIPREIVKTDSIHPDDASLQAQLVDDIATSDSTNVRVIAPALQSTTQKAETYDREIKAFYGVRFYRSDFQGVCDSMMYNTSDSILHLYKDPILWNEQSQLSGDTIDVFMKDSTIDYVHVKKYSFSIEQKRPDMFNQTKGRSMKAFFENGKMRSVLVEGNVESIFYPEEKDKSIIGHNKTESSYLQMWLKDGTFEKLKLWGPKSTGKMTPLDQLEQSQKTLSGFYWYDYLRPISKDDIFRKASKKATDTRPVRADVFKED